MTTFNDREKSFEKKFAMDEELKFKAERAATSCSAQWAAAKLGLSGTALDDYVKAVRKADLAEKGDEDVFRKIRKDLEDKGVARPRLPSCARRWPISWPTACSRSRREAKAGKPRGSLSAARGASPAGLACQQIDLAVGPHYLLEANPLLRSAAPRGEAHGIQVAHGPAGQHRVPSTRSGRTCARKPRRPFATSRRSAASSMRRS